MGNKGVSFVPHLNDKLNSMLKQVRLNIILIKQDKKYMLFRQIKDWSITF